MSNSEVIIERTTEPLEGKRGQLHQAVFVDGEQIPELSYPVGSPAPIETVREHEETIKIGKRTWKL